jgi:2-polyprenyl-3-methyl-5-hydroxy-6-metoxy-1,4-benzoquinol methylase
MTEQRYTPDSTVDEIRRSDQAAEALNQWWNRAHETDHAYWLTGSPGPEVWARLGVEELLVPGAQALNIGVGLGRCTRDLAERGCAVSVLDISPAAVERVSDVAAGYLADNLSSLPSGRFDVALSHLVAQHMSDADLSDQIHHVLRSLKPGGIFAMQYANHKFGVADDQPQSLDMLKGGSICRQEDQMAALVARAGGCVVRSYTKEAHECGIIFQVAHIQGR